MQSKFGLATIGDGLTKILNFPMDVSGIGHPLSLIS